MRTKLWMGVGAFVVAQSGQGILTEAAAKPLAPSIDQVGEGGENERGEGEGEGEGRHVVRSTKSRHVVRNPRRARAAQQHAGQRGEGEYEGGENEAGEGEGER
ncbi:hypothetical protein [Sphingomonas sp. PP-CC-1A-547]|uniref:hypothetical protein n=1 Tax=Sphingomonas sp. PP-CC-1A-547 TaxID=2135654 RepID=UPI000FF4903D|nr:hypothetical protein [Sphingomonas sp. PP-CC-1A-547]RKE49721.1 hypothetical protein C8J39_1274 [Sphingomonas sp. PP-CC-1A-547]TCM08050.1 hypothetical protein C8J41_1027 [Sphingomonas sp. PP-CC-3G-468]